MATTFAAAPVGAASPTSQTAPLETGQQSITAQTWPQTAQNWDQNVSTGAQQWGQQASRNLQRFGAQAQTALQQTGAQIQQGAQQAGQQIKQAAQQTAQKSQSWLCRNILPPRHDAGKAIALAVGALIIFVVGAALGAWRSWIAIILGIAAAVAIFVAVYIAAAQYDYKCRQNQCATNGAPNQAGMQPWWEVKCNNNAAAPQNAAATKYQPSTTQTLAGQNVYSPAAPSGTQYSGAIGAVA